MIQKHPQVITVLLISENEEKVQNFMKRINSNKLENQERTINLYYQPIDLNNDHKCLQQLSMFEYAILFLKDLEFHQFTMDNYNFRMLKLLQFYKYKQIFIIYDENDSNSSIAQLQNLYSWIDQEVNSIFYDERFNDQQEENQLGFSIPKIKILSEPTQNDFMEFFNDEADIKDSDLILAIINETEVNKGIAQVIDGFILNGQTVLYQEQVALQKVQIKNFVDYFSKQEKNFAQKGDIIEFQFDLKKKINGLLIGLRQDKYLLQPKEIKGDFICPQIVGQGGIQKIQKSDSKAFFYGIECQIEKKKIFGQLENGTYKDFKNITSKPFGMSFRISKQLYLTPNILQKNIILSIPKNKNLTQQQIFCGKIKTQDIFQVTKVQVQKKKVVLIPELTSIPSENMINNGVDYRQRCRVCRTERARYVPTNCGHLRYCNDCKDICMEAKQCLYCDKPSNNTQSFNIHLTKQQLQNLKSMTEQQIIEYFANHPDKEMLPFMKVYNEINDEQNIYFEVNCDNCDSRITQYSICINNHQTLLCDECQIKECQACKDQLQNKQKIIFTFPDDPTA
ncbi:unnamed protein product (macronuclear) [Paramecium tetraurelia]|uniref:RING-type domain-containing protein n=1 Tax=Paramecium tetraurelia TaxID=5888 RepID=A0D2U7_PARTE|nr:uncharacterized protein GSPATT00012872001 [Paramecium tetraurelia]CAK77364.1 unnamed protein product [Paramecium tetraurelia]|eukprot:XP_001444761.1 hypothetical protein (macronuclear) [Paramecium tetraurelia strain d4-2]